MIDLIGCPGVYMLVIIRDLEWLMNWQNELHHVSDYWHRRYHWVLGNSGIGIGFAHGSDFMWMLFCILACCFVLGLTFFIFGSICLLASAWVDWTVWVGMRALGWQRYYDYYDWWYEIMSIYCVSLLDTLDSSAVWLSVSGPLIWALFFLLGWMLGYVDWACLVGYLRCNRTCCYNSRAPLDAVSQAITNRSLVSSLDENTEYQIPVLRRLRGLACGLQVRTPSVLIANNSRF